MKSEILSYFPETTSFSFSLQQVRMGVHTDATGIRIATSLSLFSLLCICFFFSPASAQASWLSDIFSQPATNVSQPAPSLERKSPETAGIEEQQRPNLAQDFQTTIHHIAEQLFSHLYDADPQTSLLADGIAFTVFADLKKLTRTSSFGRYLSEQLMGEFQQRGYPVIEVRKSASIMVMEKRGEYGLSRDLEEITATAPARTMVTGTYTITDGQILVNAKIIDNATATLLSSATAIFDKNKLTDTLLADASSAYAKKDSFVYMKRLEL